ncbi:DUF1566 domain-containing protein [candidate division KSB1 bacterium]|nr:DUF1566 domain-containing protein [candidate division KSB1 bacterium]
MDSIKQKIFFSLVFLMILCWNLYPQSRDIEQIYQRPEKKSWGQLYNWALGRSEFNKSYALVIGIGDYQKDWPDLEASSRDAERIRDFLIQDEGFDYVITLTNSKATKQKINKLMEETFPKILGEKDRFFFYLSGHGTQRIKGEIISGYLVLSNCGKEDYAEMISMDDISRWDRWLYQTRHVLFMLDCCFSGLAGQQHKAALIDKKLERLSQYAHHLITAGTANESSVASLANWQGSLFTDAFLKAVSGRGDLSSADYGTDGVVCLKEFMKYVDDRIDDESVKLKNRNPLAKGVKMSPQISDLQESEGEFFFITKKYKNQKLQNYSDAPLNYGWPIERKGPIETIIPPKSEPEPQKTVVSRDPEIIKPILRDKAVTLTADQVEAMLADKKFFDRDWNKTAPGWQNQFVPQTIQGDKVVMDRGTGLMWQQGGSSEYMTFSNAQKWIDDLNRKGYAGYHDWRLPTLEEAMSLMESRKMNGDLYIDPVFDKTQRWIWTADLSNSKDSSGGSLRWVVYFDVGGCDDCDVNVNHYVRLVRSGLSSTGE